MKLISQIMLSILFLPVFVNAVITSDQLEFYQQNGFLVLPDFYSEADCDHLKNHVLEIIQSFDESSVCSVFAADESAQTIQRDSYFLNSGGNTSFFFEKDVFAPDGSLKYPKEFSLNKIGHAMHDVDPQFNAFSRNPKLAELTADLGVYNPLLLQSMYIFKQPYIGGEVFCHQDSTFLISEPNTIIGYWVAIEDATLDNGCLWAIPGEHKSSLKALYIRKNDQTELVILDSTPWNNDKLIPLPVKKGTLIVLHGLLPHMSYMNTSPKSRHAFTLHVMDASSHFSEYNWLRRPANFPFTGF